VALNCLRNCHLLREFLHGIFTFQFFKLTRCVLVEELVNGEVTTTDTDVDLVFFNSDADLLATELVDTLTLTHEHDFQLLAVRVVVYVLSYALIDNIILYGDVDRNT